MSSVTLFLVGIAFSIVLALLLKRLKFLYALRKIPAPMSLPLIGNAIQLQCSQEEFFKRMLQWSREFGDIFLVWVGLQPFIFIYRVEDIQLLLSSSVHINKSAAYEFLRPWLGTGLVTSNGNKWYTRRKLITPSFHSGLLEQYLRNSIREADILVTKLRAEVNKDGFNIVPYAKLAALDVICVSAMGYHINAQSNRTNEYVRAVDKAARITQERFVNIWISLDVIFKRTTIGKEFKKALEIMDKFTEQVITERKAEWRSKRDGNFNEFPKKRKALLDMLLEMSDDGKVLSDEDIREEVNTFMFAGHDTVATSVSWILYALGRFPKYQNLILEEYDRIIGSNDITLENLNKLDWLEACIKESWRLYPVTPLIARQICDPLRLRDTDVPSGSTILINLYILNRDPRHYAQPEMYYPERFLPDKPKPPPFAFIPFSAGSRNCIGAKFALMEVKVMILRILNAYNIHSLDSEDKLRLTAELVLTNTAGIRLAITPRHSPA